MKNKTTDGLIHTEYCEGLPCDCGAEGKDKYIEENLKINKNYDSRNFKS